MIILKTTARIVEEPALVLSTTGVQGGDAGHGGEASLGMILPSTGAHLHIKSDKGEVLFDKMIEGESLVHLSVFGDWELNGLWNAVLELAAMMNRMERP